MKLSKDQQLKEALEEIKTLNIGIQFLKQTRDLYYNELEEMKHKRNHEMARHIVTWVGILSILSVII